MTSQDMNNEPEDELPQEVIAILRQRNGPQTPIPQQIDEAVLTDARRHLRSVSQPLRRRQRARRALIALSTSTVAAAVLLISLKSPWNQSAEPQLAQSAGVADAELSPSEVVNAVEDIDQNGQINILDAFALARHVESGAPMVASWDQNSDGIVDNDDVRLVAFDAVML